MFQLKLTQLLPFLTQRRPRAVPRGFQYKNSAWHKLYAVQQACGELCNTTRPLTPGPYFQHSTSEVNCRALFKASHQDAGHGGEHAPETIPAELLPDFTMDGRVPTADMYLDQQYLGVGAKVPVWSRARVTEDIKLASEGRLRGTYNVETTREIMEGLAHADLEGKRVLVIGSERPWVEACILASGAKEVVTLEYGAIRSEHEQVTTVTPDAFREQYLGGHLEPFDAVVTFSSVEHSGLGRYGDALNPWGDLVAVARAWCVTKPGGTLTIGVPWGKDEVVFNAHRQYGPARYPYLVTNWKQKFATEKTAEEQAAIIAKTGFSWQRVFVLTREEPTGSCANDEFM